MSNYVTRLKSALGGAAIDNSNSNNNNNNNNNSNSDNSNNNNNSSSSSSTSNNPGDGAERRRAGARARGAAGPPRRGWSYHVVHIVTFGMYSVCIHIYIYI